MKLVGQCNLKVNGPGAVQEPASGNGEDGTVAGEQPHNMVLKDGFWSVGCRLDAMQMQGDKYGDEAQSYEKGLAANTSIVRYDDILDRENQQPMSPDVCFNFCRTVPEMSFFGIVHGRDCYCMHYYIDTAGGSGVCDLPCEGDTSAMCGGEHKSSIYQMHSCEGGLAKDYEELTTDLEDLVKTLGKQKDVMTGLAQSMQASGDALDALADGFASPLAQEAKVVAGPLTRSSEDVASLMDETESLLKEASNVDGLVGPEMDFETRKEVEDGMAKGHDLMDAAEEVLPAAASWADKTSPNLTLAEGFNNTFVPILRQVEADLVARQSVCVGDTTGEPMVGLSYDECTEACDKLAPKSSEEHCISVQFVELPGQETLCFMFKELTELAVYGCDYAGTAKEEEEMPEKFLQVARKHVRKHAHHHKHRRAHVRKHRQEKKQARKHEMLSHPSLKYVLQDLEKTEHHLQEPSTVSQPEALCSIRYSSTYGVTPEFFDGMTKLKACFGGDAPTAEK